MTAAVQSMMAGALVESIIVLCQKPWRHPPASSGLWKYEFSAPFYLTFFDELGNWQGMGRIPNSDASYPVDPDAVIAAVQSSLAEIVDIAYANLPPPWPRLRAAIILRCRAANSLPHCRPCLYHDQVVQQGGAEITVSPPQRRNSSV